MIEEASDDQNKKAAHAHGEANAYSTVGILGGAVASTLLVSADALVPAAAGMAEGMHNTKNTWKKIGLATGIVAIGALFYAAVKYRYAKDIEVRNKEANDWRSYIKNDLIEANQSSEKSL